MWEFIQRYWLEVLFGGVIAALTGGYRRLSRLFKRKMTEQATVKEGVLALLHDRLYQACRFYLEQGWCGVNDLKNVEYLYNAYHDLGGNGTGTELYNRVKSLPIQGTEQD